MQKRFSNKTKNDIFAAGLFFLVGLVIRLSFVSKGDFPLNDGGLFTRMVEELVANNFRLPYFTDFNLSDIPYVYPPLGFYLAAAIVRFSGVSALRLMQYLPAVLSCLTVPAFYFLSKRFLKSDLTVYIATAIYIVVPRSWMWLVMGGGLTRSLGILFAILAVLFAHRLFLDLQTKDVVLAALFTSLTILSHPETAVFVVASIILLYLVFSRTLAGFYRLCLVGLGTLALTSVWWLTAVLRHGLDPLLAAFGTNGFGIKFIRDLLLFGITEEADSHIIATLAVLGFFYLLSKKQLYIPLWLVVTLIVTPRSSANFAMIPVAMMAGLAITKLVLPVLNRGNAQAKSDGPAPLAKFRPIALAFLIYFFISALLSANVQFYIQDSVLGTLSGEERAGMEWVAENTAPDSKFVIMTEYDFWLDYYSEWFPYLARRQSLTTLQGSEWLPDDIFNQRAGYIVSTRQCLGFYPGCLEAKIREYDIPLTHVYLPKTVKFPSVLDSIEALEMSDSFQLVYDGPGAAVFEYSP